MNRDPLESIFSQLEFKVKFLRLNKSFVLLNLKRNVMVLETVPLDTVVALFNLLFETKGLIINSLYLTCIQNEVVKLLKTLP